jgi:hypothetical protein
MPAPEHKRFYGHAWRTKTRPEVLRRAGYECERCGIGDQPRGWYTNLEVAHLDGSPANDDPINFACLCRRCHRKHDYASWSAKTREWRVATKDAARPILVMLQESEVA